MRGITVKEFGGPEVLQYAENLPAPPAPTGTKVLIQVKSVGVNPVDTYIRSGTHVMKPALPYTPGADGAGIVQDVGPLVTKFKAKVKRGPISFNSGTPLRWWNVAIQCNPTKGDRVWWCQMGSGSYAELVLNEENTTYPLHSSLSFAQGAALGTPYFSALRAVVTKARLKAGETILVHGASGAVGLACVQIARALGATVLGTAGTEEGLKLITEHGAHRAFNHRQPGYTDDIKSAGSLDVIIEMLANVNLEKDMELAGAGTRIVLVGSRGRIEVTPRLLMTSEATVTGIQLWKATPADWREMVALLGAGQEQGWVRPVINQEFPLAQAIEAQRQVIEQAGGSKGKIVLTV